MPATPTVWNDIFTQKGQVFFEPHEAMPKLTEQLHQRGARRVLDLGSGSGRHVLFFAQQGFDAYGLDSAPQGMQMTKQRLASAGLAAELTVADIYEPLPYTAGYFDAVVSTQVIHHAAIADIRRLIAELERILRPGGLLFVTVAKAKNQGTTFKMIAPDTFVPLDGREAGLTHYFFTAASLRTEFARFVIRDIGLDSTGHYYLLADKPGGSS